MKSALRFPCGSAGLASYAFSQPNQLPDLVILRAINPIADPNWDELVLSHPGCTIFHSTAWARVLQETYGHEPRYRLDSSGLSRQCLVPIMEVRSKVAGARGVCVPFSDRCGPLIAEGLSFPLDEVLDQGRERGWRYFEWRDDPAPAGHQPEYLQFFNHVISLEQSETQLFDGFDGSMRRAVRKAQSGGVQVEILESQGAVAEYYHLHCLTRRKHGLPPQPWHFFSNMQQFILAKGLGFVALARHEGRAIAGAVILWLGRRAIYKFGASDEKYLSLRANNLVMWESMRCLVRKGCESMDLGRTSRNNEGLRRFKRFLGASEKVLSYYRFDFRSSAFVVGHDQTSGWHNRVFRWLPAPLSRIAGAILYKHLT